MFLEQGERWKTRPAAAIGDSHLTSLRKRLRCKSHCFLWEEQRGFDTLIVFGPWKSIRTFSSCRWSCVFRPQRKRTDGQPEFPDISQHLSISIWIVLAAEIKSKRSSRYTERSSIKERDIWCWYMYVEIIYKPGAICRKHHLQGDTVLWIVVCEWETERCVGAGV